MPTVLELLREGKNQELWEKCCGFINLTIEQFMTIQRRLLLEQIELLKDCKLGRQIMRGAKPRSLEEFRQKVPLTRYADYATYLLEQREDVLPEKPMLWQHTSGRSSEYSYKWVPVTARMYRELGDAFMALLFFASCTERGEVTLEENDKFLYGLAPPPYASGCWGHRAAEEGIFEFLPPMEKAESMGFEKRVEEGFRLGLIEGIDIMAAISSMLVAIGERFGQGGDLKRAASLLSKPRLLPRLLSAMVKSKLARRPMLPKDIWQLKALVSTGTDSVVYRQKIRETWGRYPLDIYGATESVIIAMQTWDYADMTFVPNLNLLEFMPEAEYARWATDPAYRPKTLLLDEVIPGERYVVVITNFLGGAFVRYVIGDIVKITSLRNEKLNINLPQMVFYSRADGVLDFTYASFTEKVIWQAIEGSGLSYVDWVARKEIQEARPHLHIYIELKNMAKSGEEASGVIDQQFKSTKEDYALMTEAFGYNLLKVTPLPSGAFAKYIMKRRAAGSDLAHLKPPRINPTDEALAILLNSEHEAVTAV
jgi:hypothetical protein